MKIVEIRKEGWTGKIFAFHSDDQNISGLYPEGYVYLYGGSAVLEVGGDLPTELNPAATEELVEKRPFIDAITALLTEEQKTALAGSWQTQAWIAQLPGELVNLLDPDVSAFFVAAGLTLDQVKAQMFLEVSDE